MNSGWSIMTKYAYRTLSNASCGSKAEVEHHT